MCVQSLRRWLVGRSVVFTFGILGTLSLGNVVYHEGVAGLVSLLGSMDGLIVYLAVVYPAAVALGAAARWANVYDRGAWSADIGRAWAGIRARLERFFGIERSSR